MKTSEFNTMQAHVLLELGRPDHASRWTMDELDEQMSYLEDPEAVRAAVERLRLVGLIYGGGHNEVWISPEARYMRDIEAIED